MSWMLTEVSQFVKTLIYFKSQCISQLQKLRTRNSVSLTYLKIIIKQNKKSVSK